jgi:pimeloyl-ACP methyl ester carboxylesterase
MRRFGKAMLVVLALLGAAFLVLRTPDTDPAAMRAKYGTPPSRFVDLGGGLTVHLRDEGPRGAPAIVLLHGSNADLHTWDPWTRGLTGQYRVIRFDTIGHGLTGPVPGKDYSLAAMTALVGKVADKLELKRFILAGNSMGGWVAANYAVEHPERLDGLILVDAGGAPKKGNERGNIGFKLAAMPGISSIMGQITPRWIVARSLEQSVSNKAIVTDSAIDRYWELLRYPGNREATMIRFSAPRVPHDPARLATIKVPTLILWGEEDGLIGLDGARFYNRAIAGSMLKTYPGIGHLPMEEAPDATLADLKAWLATQGVQGKPG